jgi:hypothetical protein
LVTESFLRGSATLSEHVPRCYFLLGTVNALRAPGTEMPTSQQTIQKRSDQEQTSKCSDREDNVPHDPVTSFDGVLAFNSDAFHQ